MLVLKNSANARALVVIFAFPAVLLPVNDVMPPVLLVIVALPAVLVPVKPVAPPLFRMVAWLAVVARPKNSASPPVLFVIVAEPAVVNPWGKWSADASVTNCTCPSKPIVMLALPAVVPAALVLLEKVIIPPLAVFSVGRFDELLTMPSPSMIFKA